MHGLPVRETSFCLPQFDLNWKRDTRTTRVNKCGREFDSTLRSRDGKCEGKIPAGPWRDRTADVVNRVVLTPWV